MIRVEIKDSSEASLKSFRSKKDDRVFTKQKAWAHLEAEPYPVQTWLWVRDRPLPPGEYVMTPASIRVDRYGEFNVSPILVLASEVPTSIGRRA